MRPRTLAYFILVGYFFILVMSAAHLASWFALTSKDLPTLLPWGLAAVLEGMVFLFALVTHLHPGISKWAPAATYFALGIVWLGNYRSMLASYTGNWAWEPLVQSLFVVMSFFAGKVAGELFREEERAVPSSWKEAQPLPASPAEGSRSDEAVEVSPAEKDLVRTLLEANPSGLSLEEVSFFTGLSLEGASGAVEALRREGKVRVEGGKCVPLRVPFSSEA